MTITQFPTDFIANVERAVWAREGAAIKGGAEVRHLCAAHPDKNPSARYNTEQKVWRCDACGAGGGVLDLAEKLGIERPRSDTRGPASNAQTRVDASPVVTTYAYTDVAGDLVRQVIRRANKTFAQRAPDGKGGWTLSMTGVPNPLYMLPNVAVAIESGLPVYGAEGEKDADSLTGLGLCGTTSAMGAGKFTAEHADSLRGADVRWFIDNDEPGRKHGLDVAQKCAGKVASFKILTPPAPHKDVSDWIEAGATREDIERLAEEAPEWKRDTSTIDRTRAMSANDFLALDIPPPKWLITGHLPEQAIGYVVGLPKVFKSFYALELAFAVANGAAFLGRFDSGLPLKERRVLLVQFESSMPSFQGRVRAAAQRHGIANGLHVLSNVPVVLEDQASRERIERELEAVRPELLILDPLAAMTTGDENSATEMGVVVRTLRGWRDTYGCAILTVHHANKTKQEGAGRAGLKMRGSTALYGSSEATISIERPNDDEPRIHVRSEVKDGESPRPYVCEFDPASSTLRVSSDTIHHMVTDDAIVAVVAAAKAEGIDQGSLAEALEISSRTVRDRVRGLVGKKIWVKPGTGRGRIPMVYVSKSA